MNTKAEQELIAAIRKATQQLSFDKAVGACTVALLDHPHAKPEALENASNLLGRNAHIMARSA